MICNFCHKDIPEESVFCLFCGKKQERVPRARKRGNGTGTVYKRGNTWQAEACRYVGDQRLRAYKGGFRTKKEALAYLEHLSQETNITRTKSISFVDLWKKVQETERYKELSYNKKITWSTAYKRCSELQKAADFREVRYEQMQACVTGLTFYPARDVKILLNAMSTLALKCDWADKNYAELIELPALEKGEKVVLSDEELKKIWACTDPFRDYVLIMCYLGLRPIELRKLRKEDIHLEERYTMGGQKTELGKESPIAIPEVMVPIMGNFVPITCCERDFLRNFYSCIEAAGIANDDHHISPVCCRHTYVTRLSRTGASVAVLQKAARHTKYQTTAGYTHMDISDVLDAVNKL